jgi:hypothetical protein
MLLSLLSAHSTGTSAHSGSCMNERAHNLKASVSAALLPNWPLNRIKAPPPATRTWPGWASPSSARRAGTACCARPGGRARAGRPSGRRQSPQRQPSADNGALLFAFQSRGPSSCLPLWAVSQPHPTGAPRPDRLGPGGTGRGPAGEQVTTPAVPRSSRRITAARWQL